MSELEKQFLERLPQNQPKDALSILEVRAYEAFVRSIALGKMFGFVVSGKMTTGDIIDQIGYAVLQGDPHNEWGMAQWLVLTDQEKVRVRTHLEKAYTHYLVHL